MIIRLITLATVEPTEEPIQVEAHIFGQLAVHEDDECATVTHIKSGCMITDFSWLADADDFAEEASNLMDFDLYAQLIVSGGYEAAKLMFSKDIEAVRDLRESYNTHITTVNAPYATREQMKERMQS